MSSSRRRSARTARGSSPGADDKTAKVWDAKSGAEVLTLKGHTGRVISASFSPDGSRIVTGSDDKTAKVWDAQERRRGPHPQGAHRCASIRRRSARTARGSSPGVTTRRRRSGTRRAVPRSSRSRGTPMPSIRRRSARTARGSSPGVTTGRRRSGTRQSGAEVLTLKGHTGCRHVGVVQPGRLADRHREHRQDGEGLGRDERRRGPHAQGAHRWRQLGVVQPGRLADRHRE